MVRRFIEVLVTDSEVTSEALDIFKRMQLLGDW
jgi:hypothetical protein